RPDGRVGTRNTVSILSSVNCSADTVYRIAERLRPALAEFPNVDDIVPIGHKGGCGTQMGGADHKQLQRTIAGFADHPNVGAYMRSEEHTSELQSRGHLVCRLLL